MQYVISFCHNRKKTPNPMQNSLLNYYVAIYYLKTRFCSCLSYFPPSVLDIYKSFPALRIFQGMCVWRGKRNTFFWVLSLYKRVSKCNQQSYMQKAVRHLNSTINNKRAVKQVSPERNLKSAGFQYFHSKSCSQRKLQILS